MFRLRVVFHQCGPIVTCPELGVRFFDEREQKTKVAATSRRVLEATVCRLQYLDGASFVNVNCEANPGGALFTGRAFQSFEPLLEIIILVLVGPQFTDEASGSSHEASVGPNGGHRGYAVRYG